MAILQDNLKGIMDSHRVIHFLSPNIYHRSFYIIKLIRTHIFEHLLYASVKYFTATDLMSPS